MKKFILLSLGILFVIGGITISKKDKRTQRPKLKITLCEDDSEIFTEPFGDAVTLHAA